MKNIKLLTVNQVVEITGICRNTLASWRHAGTGPDFIKAEGQKGRVFYKPEAIEKWISKNSIKTTNH